MCSSILVNKSSPLQDYPLLNKLDFSSRSVITEAALVSAKTKKIQFIFLAGIIVSISLCIFPFLSILLAHSYYQLACYSCKIFIPAILITSPIAIFLFQRAINLFLKLFIPLKQQSNNFYLLANTLLPKAEISIDYRRPFSEKHRKTICEIMTILSEKSKQELFLHYKNKLENLGKTLHRIVHPLQYLSVVITDIKLKNALKKVRKDHLKYFTFIKRFSEDLNSYPNVQLQAKKFIKDHNLDINRFIKAIEKKDWSSFINLVLDS